MGSVGRLTGFKCTSTLLLISSSDSLSKEDSRGDFKGFYNFKKRNLLAVASYLTYSSKDFFCLVNSLQ